MTKFEELVQAIEEVKSDADKIYVKGNKQAGARLRQVMQNVRGLAKEVRAEVQTLRKKE